GRIADAGKTTRRRGSPEYRGRTRVACRRDYRRRRRDSSGGVAPSTQREQGNEDDDETEVPSVADAVVLGACPQGARWGQALSRHDPVTPRVGPTRFSYVAPPTAQGKPLSRSASTAARQSAHYTEHDRRAPQRHGFSVPRARNTPFSLTTSPFPTKTDARPDADQEQASEVANRSRRNSFESSSISAAGDRRFHSEAFRSGGHRQTPFSIPPPGPPDLLPLFERLDQRRLHHRARLTVRTRLED